MKALIQRVLNAKVTVDQKIVGQIGQGLLIFLGVAKGDEQENADFLARKICHLRIFEDENGKMNKSLLDIKGEALIVSQFTLCGDVTRGNRPGFEAAAEPLKANELYEYFIDQVQKQGVFVQHGVFGVDMKVELLNDGPVTFWLEK